MGKSATHEVCRPCCVAVAGKWSRRGFGDSGVGLEDAVRSGYGLHHGGHRRTPLGRPTRTADGRRDGRPRRARDPQATPKGAGCMVTSTITGLLSQQEVRRAQAPRYICAQSRLVHSAARMETQPCLSVPPTDYQVCPCFPSRAAGVPLFRLTLERAVALAERATLDFDGRKPNACVLRSQSGGEAGTEVIFRGPRQQPSWAVDASAPCQGLTLPGVSQFHRSGKKSAHSAAGIILATPTEHDTAATESSGLSRSRRTRDLRGLASSPSTTWRAGWVRLARVLAVLGGWLVSHFSHLAAQILKSDVCLQRLKHSPLQRIRSWNSAA